MKEVKAVSLVEAAERRPGASFGNHWSRAHRVPPPWRPSLVNGKVEWELIIPWQQLDQVCLSWGRLGSEIVGWLLQGTGLLGGRAPWLASLYCCDHVTLLPQTTRHQQQGAVSAALRRKLFLCPVANKAAGSRRHSVVFTSGACPGVLTYCSLYKLTCWFQNK